LERGGRARRLRFTPLRRAIGKHIGLLYPSERAERGVVPEEELAQAAVVHEPGVRRVAGARSDGDAVSGRGSSPPRCATQKDGLRGFAHVTNNITERKRQNLLAEASLALVSCLDCERDPRLLDALARAFSSPIGA